MALLWLQKEDAWADKQQSDHTPKKRETCLSPPPAKVTLEDTVPSHSKSKWHSYIQTWTLSEGSQK